MAARFETGTFSLSKRERENTSISKGEERESVGINGVKRESSLNPY